MVAKLLLQLCYTVIQPSLKGFQKLLGGDSCPVFAYFCQRFHGENGIWTIGN
jgi:hypothetical protein